MQTGLRTAAKRFGSAAPDVKTVITAACQFGTARNATYIAVATAQDDFNCFRIYLFDACRSAIVKAIQIPFVVCLSDLQFLSHIFLLNNTFSVLSVNFVCRKTCHVLDEYMMMVSCFSGVAVVSSV